MENISLLRKYNTDIYGSWGIGHITKPITTSFEEVLQFAIEIHASVIVKPSRGNNWYIKGLNNSKSFVEIQNHVETNHHNNYRNKSNLWLINY